MRRMAYESAAAPTPHNVADPAKLNVVCRTLLKLPDETDSNSALLLYFIHQLGSAHELSSIWNRPKFPDKNLSQAAWLLFGAAHSVI